MNQQEFSKIKKGDMVLAMCKGHIVKAEVDVIYDNGHRKRSVVLKNLGPNMPDTILRHMYNIYSTQISEKESHDE